MSIKNTLFITTCIFLSLNCKIHSAEKIKYFNYMFIDKSTKIGKVSFLSISNESGIHDNEFISVMPKFYKVFHNGMPLRVEEYDRKSRLILKTYFLDKQAVVYRYIIHKDSKKILCKIDYKFDTKKDRIDKRTMKYDNNITKTFTYIYKYYIQTDICDDNTKIITTSEPKNRIFKKLYYSNDKLIKVENYKGVYIETYNAQGKLLHKIKLDTSDYLPVRLPEYDDYPWKK